MNPTTHDAQIAGMMAGMLTGSSRDVPAEFAGTERLRDAWLDGYDSMTQALRGCEPAPAGAPKASRPRRSAPKKIVKVKTVEPAPPQPAKPPMRAILERLHHQAQA